jgi:hypothetical protein
MPTTPLLIRLPDELVRHFRRSVSVRQRSKFIQRLLEDALPPDDGSNDDPLYRVALAVEEDAVLTSEMGEWETATLDDGFTEDGSKRHARRSTGT